MNKQFLKMSLGILQTILTFAAVSVLLVRAHTLRNQIVFTESRHNIELVILCAVLFGVFYFILALHWLLAVRIFKPKTDKKMLLSFYASQPYKYLPTSLFTFSFRSKFARDQGLTIVESSKAQVIENGNLIASGMLTAALALIWLYSYVLFGLSSIVLVTVLFAVSRSQRELAIKFGKRRFSVRPAKLVPMIVLAVLGWVTAGLALWVLSLSSISSVGILHSVAANSLAFSASILAIFAPGGIGVRELIYAHFNVALTSIVMWRLLTLVLDMSLGFTAALKIAYLKRKA